MKSISKKIVFFGNERLATGVVSTCPTFRALIDAGYEITALVSNYKQAQSRRNSEPSIHNLARQNNIPILSPKKMIDIYDDLKSLNAEIGVLVAFGKIVPQSIIDIFPHGIINIHPSLLPKHRGSTPIESVILSGEKQTGVSVMKLVSKMDAGPIYAKATMGLETNEAKQSLADQLLHLGSELVIKSLPPILDGELKPSEQDDSSATYDEPIQKQDGTIDWSNPAQTIERQVRAYQNWPQSKTALNTVEVIITGAHALSVRRVDAFAGDVTISEEEPYITVATGDGTLSIDSVKPLGKNEMSVESFLAGYKNRLSFD